MLDIFLNSVVPAFVVITIGILLGSKVASGIAIINRLALYAAVPALVFTSLLASELTLSGAVRLVIGHGLFLVAMYLLAQLLSSRYPPGVRRAFVATSVFGNAANLMLPITLFALGEAALERAILLYVFVTIVLYTLGPLVLAGREGMASRSTADLLRLPVVWAAVAGVALNLLGWELPTGLSRGFDLLSDAAIPLVLLVLGIQIYRSGLNVPGRASFGAALFKLLIGPLVGYGVAFLVGARGLDLSVLTLLAAMPPAVNTLILAIEFGGDADQVAKTLVLATLGSLLSLTVVIALLT
ncbi:MAG: AEC family transporter [Trueperaceae bacterium]|nr:MAG: AEC family transporter [Trueperaceae bacterium]